MIANVTENMNILEIAMVLTKVSIFNSLKYNI